MSGGGAMPLPRGGEVCRGYSFVIPTIGRIATLGVLLRQVVSTVTLPFEVVVVFDGENPDLERSLRDVMESLPAGVGTFVPLGQHRGVAAARNAGIAKASFQFCVFLDDDVVLAAGWWDAVVRHTTTDAACITGPILTQERSVIARARAQRYEARYKSLATGDEVSFLAGGNSIVSRADLVAAGGFPLVKVGSDSLLIGGLRSRSIACRFVWEVSVYHQHDRGVALAVSNAFQAGRNVRSLVALHGEARRWWIEARTAQDLGVTVLNAGLMVAKTLGFVCRPWGAR